MPSLAPRPGRRYWPTVRSYDKTRVLLVHGGRAEVSGPIATEKHNVHLLIAGIPGTGKSTFARWLINHHHYVRCPFGEEPGPTFWSDINEDRATRTYVVIDCGIPVSCFPAVLTLISSDVKSCRFYGDTNSVITHCHARPAH